VTDRPEQWPHLDDILAAFTPADAAEQQFKVRMSALLTLEPRALWRDAFSPGHFTGSALVTSPGRDQVLLMRHKYIGRWMQFGGHADGEADLSKVALREASEESGLPEHKFAVLGDVFDLDIHPIAANPEKDEPAHEHFDMRYLLELDDALPLPPNPEGLMLRWVGVDEAASLVAGEHGLRRMLAKLRNGQRLTQL
jgi:8-oxo-dGTP pyrophosphatase MutT (NUDIX family)